MTASSGSVSPPPAARRRKKAEMAGPPTPAILLAGPSDFHDPVMRKEAKKAVVWLGIAALMTLVVVLAQPLLVIFAGMVFAAAIDGGARLLGRGLPIGRGWRVGLVLLIAASFIVWVFQYTGSQLAAQAAALPATLETQAARLFAWLGDHGATVNFNDFKGLTQQAVGGVMQVTKAVGGLIGALTTFFLIMVLGIYIAAEPRLYQRGVAWMLPVSERAHFHETAALMGRSLRMLMFGRLLGMVVEGIGTWLMLAIYGVPLAGLLGLLTGLLAFLPNIGAPISGALMIMVGFSGGTEMGLYCIMVYVVVQTVDGNLIVPMVAKKTVDLAPALVLGAQLIMGAMFGILGLALADPLVAMIKIALERHAGRQEPAAAI